MPASAAIAWRMIASWRASAVVMAWGCCSHRRVLPSISVNKKVTVPLGRSPTAHLRTIHAHVPLHDSTGHNIGNGPWNGCRRACFGYTETIVIKLVCLGIPEACLGAGIVRQESIAGGLGGVVSSGGDPVALADCLSIRSV